MSIISLLSDFGQKDPYVAAMKAVILSITPSTRIVDISHNIDKFNIRMGAYILATVAPYFPVDAVHVAVVDPGVGTKRRPILIKTKRATYVGPDNGVLMLAAEKDEILKVYHIQNVKYVLSTVSNTFHGRDIFAPVAAHLVTGVEPSSFGPEIHDYVYPEYVTPKFKNGKLVGEVLHIDAFGNIISNISSDNLKQAGMCDPDSLLITVGEKILNTRFCSTYGAVPVGSLLLLIGNSNFLELALNQASAAKLFGTEVGDRFCVSKIVSC